MSRAHDAATRRHDEQGAVAEAVRQGAVGAGQVKLPDVDALAVAGFGLGHRDPGVGQLGVGERAPRHDLRAAPPTGEEGVTHGLHRFVGSDVGEAVAAGRVAGNVDAANAGAPAIVDLHAIRTDGDTKLFEAQPFYVRHTPYRHQHRFGGEAVHAPADPRPDDPLAAFDGHGLEACGDVHLHTIGAQAVGEPIDQRGLLAGEQALGALEQRDGDIEAGQRLGQLDARPARRR